MSHCGVKACKNLFLKTPPSNTIFISVGYPPKSYHMLCDSGAACSVIHKSIVQRHRFAIQPLHEPIRITTANKSQLRPIGKINIPVYIGDYTAECEFIVVDNLHCPIICGIDMMKKHKFIIDLTDDTVQVGDKKLTVPMKQYVSKRELVRLDSNIEIPALTEMLVRVKLSERYPDGTYLLEPLNTAWQTITEKKPVLVARACIKVEKNKSCCKLINVTRNVLSLSVNQAIAKIQPIKEDEISEMDERTNKSFQHWIKNVSQPVENSVDDNQSPDSVQRDKISAVSHETKINNLREMGFKLNPENMTTNEFRQLVSLLYEYKDVFADDLPGVRDLTYHIELKENSKLPKVRNNYFTPQLRPIVEKEIADWERQGIVREGNYKYAAPLLLVKKKCPCELTLKGQKSDPSQNKCSHEQKFRLCSDFRKLNEIISVSPFMIGSTLESTCDNIFSAENPPKFFSLYDARSGFLQCPLDDESSQLCGLQVFDRSFVYTRIPFGLVSSSFGFQQVLAVILKGLSYLLCNSYIDDVLLSTPDVQSHLKITREVFDRFRSYRMRLKSQKAQVCQTEIKFLGVLLSENGIRVDPERFAAIEALPIPKSKKAVASFLAMVGFWRKWIYKYSIRSEPLRKLLRKTTNYYWGDEQQKAFDDLKTCLRKEPIVLKIPDFNEKFCLFTDASENGCSYILTNQYPDASHKIISFGGRAFTDTESRYHSTKLELLGIVYACMRNAKYLLPKPFRIVTDNISSALITSLGKGRGPMSRLAMKLDAFQFTIDHMAGSKMPADFLSRIDLPKVPPNEELVTFDEHEIILSMLQQKNKKPKTILDLMFLTEAPKQFARRPTQRIQEANVVKCELIASAQQTNPPEEEAFNDFMILVETQKAVNNNWEEADRTTTDSRNNAEDPDPQLQNQNEILEQSQENRIWYPVSQIVLENARQNNHTCSDQEPEPMMSGQALTYTPQVVRKFQTEVLSLLKNGTPQYDLTPYSNALELHLQNRGNSGQIKLINYSAPCKVDKILEASISGKKMAEYLIKKPTLPINSLNNMEENLPHLENLPMSRSVRFEDEQLHHAFNVQTLPNNSESQLTAGRAYALTLDSGIIISIMQNNIVNEQADAFVNLTSPDLRHNRQIAFAMGTEALRSCNKFIFENGPIQPGDMFVSVPGKLKYHTKAIFHLPLPTLWKLNQQQKQRLLTELFFNALITANESRYKSISIPLALNSHQTKFNTDLAHALINALNKFQSCVQQGMWRYINRINFADEHHNIISSFYQLLLNELCTESLNPNAVMPFWNSHHFLSNFFPSTFCINNERFTTVEQYYQSRKALFSHNYHIHKLIMKTENPGHIKRLSKRIRYLNFRAWASVRERIMKTALMAKFSQNPDLKNALVQTKNSLLVECNPLDYHWSCGLSLNHPHVQHPHMHPGKSILGILLMEVRQELQASHPAIMAVEKEEDDRTKMENDVLREITLDLSEQYTVEQWVQLLNECPDYKHIYTYLKDQMLPSDTKVAKNTVIQSENYMLDNELLFKVQEDKFKKSKRVRRVKLLLVVPTSSLRTELIRKLHQETGHARVLRTYLTLKRIVYWPNLYKEVVDELTKCENCLLARRLAPPKNPLNHFENQIVGDHLFIDVLYLTPSTDPISGQKAAHLLTIVDQASGFCLAAPIFDLSAHSLAEAFKRSYVSLFGIPKRVTADSASNNTAKFFIEFMEQMQIKYRNTCILNHKSLTIVERKHRSINSIIRTMLLQRYDQWLAKLPEILLAINNTVSSITGIAPAEIFLAREIKLPAEAQLPTAKPSDPTATTLLGRAEDALIASEKAADLQTESRQAADRFYKASPLRNFKIGQTVLLFYEIAPKKEVAKLYPPYRLAIICEVLENNTYRLSDFHTKMRLNGRYHVDRLLIAPPEIITQDGIVIRTTNYVEERKVPLQNENIKYVEEKTKSEKVTVKESKVVNDNESQLTQRRRETADNSQDTWHPIERIIRRHRMPNGKFRYRVKWGNGEESWLEAKDITNAAVREFYKKLRTKRRRQ